jgi:hypothetical protein
MKKGLKLTTSAVALTTLFAGAAYAQTIYPDGSQSPTGRDQLERGRMQDGDGAVAPGAESRTPRYYGSDQQCAWTSQQSYGSAQIQNGDTAQGDKSPPPAIGSSVPGTQQADRGQLTRNC